MRYSTRENHYQINCSWHNQMTGGICNQEVTLESLTVLVSVRFRRELLFSFVSNLAISIRPLTTWQTRRDKSHSRLHAIRIKKKYPVPCQYILNVGNLMANLSLPRAFDDCQIWKHDKRFPPQHTHTMSSEGAEGAENCSRSILVFVTSWQIPRSHTDNCSEVTPWPHTHHSRHHFLSPGQE